MPKRVITLSSIPPRFPFLERNLRELLRHRRVCDEIRLYIPRSYPRFPEYDGSLPVIPEGVVLRRVAQDDGPATKLLGPLRDFAGEDVQILYCDDDQIYPADWASLIFAEMERRPDCAIAPQAAQLQGMVKTAYVNPRTPRAQYAGRPLSYQLRRLLQKLGSLSLRPPKSGVTRPILKREGYADVAYGVRGVGVRPSFFDARVFEIPQPFRAVDDIWISGMLALRGVPLWAPKGHVYSEMTEADQVESLFHSINEGLDRRDSNAACIQYFADTYGIWK